MTKAIDNIEKNLLIKRIIFDNLSEKTKVYIKKKTYNLVKADMKEKQKPVNKIEKKITYRNIIILIGYTIQFLLVIYRFLIKLRTIFPLSEFLLMYSVKLKVNLQLSKV